MLVYPRESALLSVRGEPEDGPSAVDGRDMELGGDAGRGADPGRDAACLAGEPALNLGDSGAVRWFPGSASGELVGGVKLLDMPSRPRMRSDAPDDRRRFKLAELSMSSGSEDDVCAVDGREREVLSPPLGMLRGG